MYGDDIIIYRIFRYEYVKNKIKSERNWKFREVLY